MRNLLIALALTLCACVAAPIDTLATDGALGRQVARMLERHDSYVIGDAELAADAAESALRESDVVRDLVLLPEVRRDSLGAAVAPVADRHDAYVRADASLEDVERETFLGSTAGLRRLLGLSE